MSKATKFITTAALLVAISILIPAVVPLIQLTPLLTMTLTAHVPIFIACFISPYMAVVVAMGATYGFFLTKPPIVTARVATHIIFAIVASLYFKKYGVPKIYCGNSNWHNSWA